MKRQLLLLLCISISIVSFAGIIVTKNEGNIENVANIAISNYEVSYTENGIGKSLPIDQVSAILYDDGRYEEVQLKMNRNVENSNADKAEGIDEEDSSYPTQEYGSLSEGDKFSENTNYTSSSSVNTFNLLAYGIFKGSRTYEVCHDYDGAVVEYRIKIKEGGQIISTNFQVIDTVPFALVSKSFKQSYCANYIKFNIDLPEEASYMQTTPFVVNGIDYTNKRNVTIEYRISKEGYKPVTFVWVETNLPQGRAICLPLNMLKPLSQKEKEKTETVEAKESPIEIQNNNNVDVAPKALTKEGKSYYYNETEMDKKAYERFLKEHCSKAAHKYQTGRQVVAAGWTIGVVGLLVTAIGIPVTRDFCDKARRAEQRYVETHAGYEPKMPMYSSYNNMEMYRKAMEEYEEAMNTFIEEYPYKANSLGYYNGHLPYFKTQAELENAKDLQQKYFTATDVYLTTLTGGPILTGCGLGILLPIGYVYKKKSVDVFNTQCASKTAKPKMTFNLKSSPNNIGLAINF